MDRKIDIFGTEYTIYDDESLVEEGFDGRVNTFDPVIRIRPYSVMLEETQTRTTRRKHVTGRCYGTRWFMRYSESLDTKST